MMGRPGGFDPARGIEKLPEGKQRRFLSIEEIGRLGAAMRKAEHEGVENPTGLAVVRFLLLTGLRRMEALALPWIWVDTRARRIRFGDTKSGPQLRPIGETAAKFLESLPRADNAHFVFPADRGDGHFIGLPRVLARACKAAKLAGVTVHVLRHSFAATAAEMGFSELTIAGLLGHSMPGITARYAHVPDRALLSAANQVSERIAAALEPNTRQRYNRKPQIRSSRLSGAGGDAR